MHFGPQVLITAIAWGAGFSQKYRDAGEEIPTPKHEAPEDIQKAYDALRNMMIANSNSTTDPNTAGKYKAICKALVEIEDNLRFLNKELSGIQLDDNSDDVRDLVRVAKVLLGAIDQDGLPKWRTRIVDYNKPPEKP